jgi:hypothetical protein
MLPFATAAQATTVTIPDPAPNPYIYFGSGDASVTYDGVTFSTSAILSDGAFYNVGVVFSGDPAVLSSQEQSVGVANILITLPVVADAFSLDYGTFNGSAVTFLLSNGDSFTQGSTGSSYATPDFFDVTGHGDFTSVLVTSGDYVLNVNNIDYSAVPEPLTLSLFGAGLLGLGALRRRKARKQ